MIKRAVIASVLLALTIIGSFPLARTNAQSAQAVYLPLLNYRSPSLSPFGVQTHSVGDALLGKISELGTPSARYGFLSWRTIQPKAGAAYNWAAVATFENTLRGMSQRGIAPLVVVGDSPSWATIPRSPGVSTSCGALYDSAFDDFAAFMAAAVARYKQPAFGVRYWELGNEMDIDPHLVDVNNGFGCWGTIGDPYYGGERYGRMLKVVTPAIKAVDPQAQVIFGGLLLNSPNTTDSSLGKPERFFEGALRGAGGAPFDILAYHSYRPYLDRTKVGQIDHDNGIAGNQWGDVGNVRGKAAFLRAVMRRYGVSRPLWLNEMSLLCPDDRPSVYRWCQPPIADFYDAQANYLVRGFVRALDEGVDYVLWYSLEDPWRQTPLLDAQLKPKLAFYTYQQLILRLSDALPLGKANYGSNLEGYRFRNKGAEVQVVWAIKGDSTAFVDLPNTIPLTAYSRDGQRLLPVALPGVSRYSVGFSPIYLVFEQ